MFPLKCRHEGMVGRSAKLFIFHLIFLCKKHVKNVNRKFSLSPVPEKDR